MEDFVMNYEEWSYENLVSLESELEESVREGQPLKTVLRAIKKEIGERRFALVLVVGKRTRKEYGRWKTKERCEKQAAAMTMPIGTKYQFEGQETYTDLIELF